MGDTTGSNNNTPAPSPAPEASVSKPLSFGAAVEAWGEDTTPINIDAGDDDGGSEPAKEQPAQSEDEVLDDVFNDDDDSGDEDVAESDGKDASDSDESDDDEDAEADDEEGGGEAGDEDEDAGQLSKEELKKKVVVKVDGKKREYTVEQLRNIAASGLHQLQKHNEFEAYKTQETKKLQDKSAELRLADEKVTPVWQKLTQKDPATGKPAPDIHGAFMELAKQAGANRLQVQKQLLVQMFPKVCQRLGITRQEAEQRLQANLEAIRILDIQDENEYLKEERQAAASASIPKAPSGDDLAKAQVLEIQRRHGFSNAELEKSYNWLAKNDREGEAGITIQKLEATALNARICDKAVEAVLAVRPTMVGNDKFVDRVVAKIKENPEWGVSRVARWVDKKARALAEKAQIDEKTGVLKDISRKVLRGSSSKDGKPNPSRFENPNTQKKPLKFSDMTREDNYQLP